MELRKITRSGAKLLTEMYGKDWYEMINIPTLDLSDPKQCILGQLYGDYYTGLEAMNMDVNLPLIGDEDPRVQSGFTMSEGNYYRHWVKLTHAWIMLILDHYRKR